MIRCVAFDFDGTLALSNGIKRQAYYDAAKQLGEMERIVASVLASESGDREEICAAIVASARKQGALHSSQNPEELTRHLVSLYSTFCEERIATCPEVPGAKAALEYLRAIGCSLFVNSATPTTPLKRILELRGLSAYFRGVLGSPGGKTDNLVQILSLEKLTAKQMLFVGDNESDRRAALEIGCDFIGIENEFSGYQEPPMHRLKDLTGLLSALEGVTPTGVAIP